MPDPEATSTQSAADVDEEEHAKVAAETASAVASENVTVPETTQPSSPAPASQTSEPGEISEGKSDTEGSQEELLRTYRWCKCSCDPAQFNGQTSYFLHMDTQESKWEEPGEPFWIWNATTQALDPCGLQGYSNPSASIQNDGPDPEYYGYNPKIHGKYDPNAPYAKYHNQKRAQEVYLEHGPQIAPPIMPIEAYTAAGAFNRVTGSFQTADRSAERHDDYNKTGRQLAAHFDVDAAANAHNGRSLKEERRNEKFTKAQIKEMMQKRRAKKEKKRLDFYKS